MYDLMRAMLFQSNHLLSLPFRLLVLSSHCFFILCLTSLLQDAVVFGISQDSVQKHADFKAHYNLPFTLLSDSKVPLSLLCFLLVSFVYAGSPVISVKSKSKTKTSGDIWSFTKAVNSTTGETLVNWGFTGLFIKSNGQLGVAPAPKTAPLSATDGERLLELVKRQQRQIERLQAEVEGG